MRRAAVLLSLLLLTACSSPRASGGDPLMPTVVTLGDSVPAGAACGCDPFPTLYARAQHAVDVNLAERGSTAAHELG